MIRFARGMRDGWPYVKAEVVDENGIAKLPKLEYALNNVMSRTPIMFWLTAPMDQVRDHITKLILLDIQTETDVFMWPGCVSG